MEYRRAQTKGGTYFFTLVTYSRTKIFAHEENIDLLRNAFKNVMSVHPLKIDAFVLLPDHLHCMWTLPVNDGVFSKRWRLIKSHVSQECDAKYKNMPSETRQTKKEQAVWQRRFWEHQIRDDRDFKAHCDYIHYNPVKHGLVKAPGDWQYSTFTRFVKQGLYEYCLGRR
ncbi:MAG: transposase [Pseudomonadota bacterium]